MYHKVVVGRNHGDNTPLPSTLSKKVILKCVRNLAEKVGTLTPECYVGILMKPMLNHVKILYFFCFWWYCEASFKININTVISSWFMILHEFIEDIFSISTTPTTNNTI